MFAWRRCIFPGLWPSRWLSVPEPVFDSTAWRRTAAEIFALVFPGECRLCNAPLDDISRIPVCRRCLDLPQPLMAEHFCASCRTPFLNRSPLDEEGRCALCRLGVTAFDEAYSFGEYDGVLRGLIHLFKYSGVTPLGPALGEFLSRALPRDTRFDLLVPMPLHWRRLWRRGFNQSALLGRELSRRTGIPVGNVLRRRRATPAQAGLTSAARRNNVAGAFVVRGGNRLDGRHVVLIDDVLTTGATATAAAAALKRGGARRVTVLTVARVDRRKGSLAAEGGLES